MEDMSEQPMTAGTPASTPVTTQPAAVTQDPKEKRIVNGTRFLSDARVKASPLSRRVNFLKSKGLSAEEIVECFSRAGQPQTLEGVQSVIAGGSGPSTTQQPATAPVPPTAPGQQQQVMYAGAPGAPAVQHQQPYYQHQAPMQPYATYQQQVPMPLLPQPPLPPPLPPRQPPSYADKWKDYVLAAGAAGLVAVGAWKAFEAYSPYEVRRKQQSVTGQRGVGRADTVSRRSLGGGVDDAAMMQQRTGSNRLAASSESELDATSRVGSGMRTSNSNSNQVANRTLPVPPPSTTAEDAVALKDKKIAELEERIKALEADVAESKATIDKEKREKAELAVNSGKLKGQLTQLGRQNEKATAEVARLNMELTQLRTDRDKTPPPAAAPLAAPGAATSGSAPSSIANVPPGQTTETTVDGPAAAATAAPVSISSSPAVVSPNSASCEDPPRAASVDAPPPAIDAPLPLS